MNKRLSDTDKSTIRYHLTLSHGNNRLFIAKGTRNSYLLVHRLYCIFQCALLHDIPMWHFHCLSWFLFWFIG